MSSWNGADPRQIAAALRKLADDLEAGKGPNRNLCIVTHTRPIQNAGGMITDYEYLGETAVLTTRQLPPDHVRAVERFFHDMYVVQYPSSRIHLEPIGVSGSFQPLHFVPNKTFMATATVKVEKGQNLRCVDKTPGEPFSEHQMMDRLTVRFCGANEVPNCVSLEHADPGDWLHCVMIECGGGIRLDVDDQGRAIRDIQKGELATISGDGLSAVAMRPLPKETVERDDGRSFASTESEAEFFKRSIMAE